MKTILLIMLLFLNGCSLDEYFTKKKARGEFNSMCHRYELIICEDDVNQLPYDEGNYYAYLFNFKYKKDNSDSYDYLTPDDEGITRGDCEDFAITFLENSIRNGSVKKGTAELILGKLNGVYHTWLIIDGELFDTQYLVGIEIDIAYMDNKYERLSSLYRY